METVTHNDFAFDLQRFDVFENYNAGSVISGTADDDNITNYSGADSVTINGNGGNDTITNYAPDVTISTGAGADYITNNYNGSNTSINAGDGDDTIDNSGSNVTIDAGAGDDYVTNSGSYASINAGDGANSITNDASRVTISAGAGNDSIYNSGYYALISAGDGANSITNRGDNVSISAGAGADYITNGGYNVLFQYSGGNDTIVGFDGDSTLQLLSGSITSALVDSLGNANLTIGGNTLTFANFRHTTINVITADGISSVMAVPDVYQMSDSLHSNSQSARIILASQGSNDSIYNNGSYVTINAADGADSIENRASNVSIAGGEGDDRIYNEGGNVTIDAGEGDDSISNSGDNVTISGGAGNDSILNSGSLTAIDAGDGDDTIRNPDAKKVSISAGAGSDSIDNDGDSVTIDAGTGDDYISNDGSNSTISAGAGADYITNIGSNVSIDAGTGNDFIYNNGRYVTINAGDGDDSIRNYGYYYDGEYYYGGSNTSINGGAGNDYIGNEGSNSTINAGTGNNYIYNEGSNVLFQYSGGNDTIYGFYKNSTLQFLDGSITSAISDGVNAASLTVGSNTIVLDGLTYTNIIKILNVGASATVNYTIPTAFEDTERSDELTIVKGFVGASVKTYAGNDTIRNYGASSIIDAGSGHDYIENNVTSYYDADGELLHRGGDYVSINAGDGNDVIYTNGARTTIFGGAGHDSVKSEGEELIYVYSGGNDKIANFNTFNTIVIEGHTSWETVSSDEGTLIRVLDNGQISGTILLEDYFGQTYIVNSLANVVQVHKISVDSSLTSGTEGRDSIYNGVADVAINAGAGEDSIRNNASDVTINAGAGDDTVSNYGSEAQIFGGEGADTIYNVGTAASIDAGEGDDSVNNTGDYALISLGDGNDFVENTGRYASINGDAGNDTITNSAINVSINSGAGDNYIFNSGTETTINGGDGADSIRNVAKYALINSGDGDDSIYNSDDAKNVTIEAGAGNDSITNYAANISISAGDGANYIQNFAGNATIEAGAGADSIHNNASNVLFKYNGGNDLIEGFDSTSTLQIVTGSLSAMNSDGMDLYLTIGQDTITLTNAYGLETLNIFDSAGNSLSTDVIGSISTTITNHESAVTIRTLDGDDSIRNDYSFVSINSGAGNDTITNNGSNVTINAGTGNDLINNDYNSSVLFQYAPDDGNDTITSYSASDTLQILSTSSTVSSAMTNGKDLFLAINNNTITFADAYGITKLNVVDSLGNQLVDFENIVDLTVGTEGDDVIENHFDEVLINGLDGNDVIENHGYNSIILTGDGNNFVSNDAGSILIEGGDGDDYISNTGKYAKINGGGGDDSIENAAKYTLIDSGEGDDNITNSDWYATIEGGDGDDTITNSGYGAKINAGAGNNLIAVTGYGSTVDVSEGNDTISVGESKTRLTVEGFGANDVITLKEEIDEILTFGNKIVAGNATISGVSGISAQSAWTLEDNVATFAESTTGNVSLASDQKTIVYAGGYSGTENVIATVSGVISTKGIEIDQQNKILTISATALSPGQTVTASDGYTLALAEDVPGVTTHEGAGWRFNGMVATYVDGSTNEGYVLENNQITYQMDGEGKALVNVTGVSSTEGLAIDLENGVVSVSANSLNEETITISDNYTLALGENIPAPSYGDVTWSLTKSAAIGRFSIASAGYELDEESNRIKYIKEGTNNTVALYGVTSTEGLEISGKTITIGYAALEGFEAGSSVKASNGYTLALGSDVISPISEGEQWSYDTADSTVIYVSASRKGGFVLKNNQVVYVGDKGEESISIVGAGSSIGIERDGDTFTIANSALNSTAVSITGDGAYELALASDVAEPVRTAANWLREDTTAIYRTASTTEGYKVVNNVVEYTAAADSQELVTVGGVSSDDKGGLQMNANDSIVTVYNSALYENAEVTISGGYSFALGSDVAVPVDNSGWSIADSVATYQRDSWTGGYILEDNKITYQAESIGTILAELGGVESNPTFVEGGESIVQLTVSNFSEGGISIISNEAEFTFDIAEDEYAVDTKFIGSANKDTVTNAGNNLILELGAGADSIVNSGDNVSIVGGAGADRIINTGVGVTVNGGAGNDNISLSGDEGGNVLTYSAGDGKDNVIGFKANDTIQIGDGSSVVAEVKNNDVVFNVGTGSITLKNIAGLSMAVTVIDSLNNQLAISGSTYSTDGVSKEGSVTLASTFTGEYTADNYDAVDGSQLNTGISIDAGTTGQTLIGGVGKDTLITGESDGFELTGNKGNDVFVYNGGRGSITDYSQKGTYGKDKVVIAEELGALTAYAVSGGNVTLNYGEGNTLTLVDAIDKEITFGTRSTTVRTYNSTGIFDSNEKSVSLAADLTNFDATRSYSKLETIDGSLVTDAISIAGNKKANSIKAGANGATISGGKGKDTLVGGESNDVFVYEAKSGNKLIQSYSEGDIISLGSGASISEVKTNGDNLVISVGNDKITIEGGAGKSFTYNDGEEKTFTANGLIASGDSVSLTSAFSGTSLNLDNSSYENADASLLKGRYDITGDGTPNYLVGSKGNDTLAGGGGNDSLWGGKGNDLLIGSDGSNDTFIFQAGDGVDTIRGFDDGDILRIIDKRGREASFSNSSFNTGTGVLTLSIKGGGKLLLEGMSAGNTVTVNSTSYTISGKKLR